MGTIIKRGNIRQKTTRRGNNEYVYYTVEVYLSKDDLSKLFPDGHVTNSVDVLVTTRDVAQIFYACRYALSDVHDLYSIVARLNIDPDIKDKIFRKLARIETALKMIAQDRELEEEAEREVRSYET